MGRYSVSVAADHVLSLTAIRNPIVAVEELIWNAVDADATEINVEIDLNRLQGLQCVRVTDNGHGLRHDKTQEAFGSVGGSPKLQEQTTPKGRVPHGKLGRGRFKAFGVGGKVTWSSRYQDSSKTYEFVITCHKATINDFEVSDPHPRKATSAGVVVEITEIEKNFPSLTASDETALELSRRLALYLRKYPGISIRYDGHVVDPREMEDHVASYSLKVPLPSSEVTDAELTVIEWKRPVERALYLCDEHGFARDEQSPGIKAKGFHFTAYLKSPLVTELEEQGAFGLGELHPSISALLEHGKKALRTHFRKREATRVSDLVRQWQEEDVYPYHALAPNVLETAEREVFDICAVKVHEYLPSFENFDHKSKQLTFRLIRQALESNATSLQTILREALSLPQEQQEELAGLLERTNLAAIINAAKVVMDRLDFLASLDQLLFGDFKKTLLEVSQLQQILTREMWLFGEQYAIGVDDESLRSLLLKHMEILERSDLIGNGEEVKDIGGKNRRLDLMLYRRYPQRVPNSYEHLVVELKRPSLRLGQKEIGQIENYAFTVTNDERFDKNYTRWTFLLLGNDFDTFAENKCNVDDREFGHIHAGSVNIFVKRWASVIDQAKWRYEFFREKLEHQVTADQALAFLRRKHSDHLPEGSEEGDGRATGSQ